MRERRRASGKVLTNEVAVSTRYLGAAEKGNRREDAIGFDTSENGMRFAVRSEREARSEEQDEGSGHVLTNQHAAFTESAGEWEGKGVTIWEGRGALRGRC